MSLLLIAERVMCRRANRPKQATPWERCCSGCCTCCHTLTKQRQPFRAMESPRHPLHNQVSRSTELSLTTIACFILYTLRRQHLPLKVTYQEIWVDGAR